MNLPLYSYEQLSSSSYLLTALFIGIGFGYILEKGGLGNAKKLIAQFLLKDLAVFKVMFTAIVTALIGVFILSANGYLIIDLIEISDSYFVPQLAGGLLLGIGFAISGYCPGTTIVGMASGKIDAIFSFIGLFLGTLLFAFVYDPIETFYYSTKIELNTLPQLFSLEFGTMVLIVTGLAITAFYFAEQIEAHYLETNHIEIDNE
jgi:uncharacterized membrane protein YedE/YeeE